MPWRCTLDRKPAKGIALVRTPLELLRQTSLGLYLSALKSRQWQSGRASFFMLGVARDA